MSDEEIISKNKSRNVERSTPYPGIVLEDAIRATGKLRTSYGATSSYSRESVAEALGHQTVSGPANKKIAALLHFGLITRQGTTYKQSEVASRIFNPLTDDEKRSATIEAFASPALYKKIIDEYNGQAIPTMFDKVLIRKYKIAENAAASAAKSFISSAEFAGVLSNGILKVDGSSSTTNEINAEVDQLERLETPEQTQTEGKKNAPFSTAGFLPVGVKGTGIVIQFPAEYAYELSIGEFAKGIKALKENADDLKDDNDEAAPETTKE